MLISSVDIIILIYLLINTRVELYVEVGNQYFLLTNYVHCTRIMIVLHLDKPDFFVCLWFTIHKRIAIKTKNNILRISFLFNVQLLCH